MKIVLRALGVFVVEVLKCHGDGNSQRRWMLKKYFPFCGFIVPEGIRGWRYEQEDRIDGIFAFAMQCVFIPTNRQSLNFEMILMLLSFQPNVADLLDFVHFRCYLLSRELQSHDCVPLFSCLSLSLSLSSNASAACPLFPLNQTSFSLESNGLARTSVFSQTNSPVFKPKHLLSCWNLSRFAFYSSCWSISFV